MERCPVDITPREYVLDYLAHSFPVQLYEPFTDSEGNLSSRPVTRDGQPVECREAARRRDALIEQLASLPPVPGALDQIVQRFGTDLVAEVTGRSRRIVRKGEGPAARLVVESRAGSANLAETAAFMDDQKRILIFSDAGGTGAAITPISAPRTSACGSTTCWNPAGRPMPPSRASGAPTAPIRRSRRCSGPSPPM
jgi:hypothetical protein